MNAQRADIEADIDADLCSVAALVERESGIQVKQPQLASLAAALRRLSPEMSAGSFIEAVRDAARAPSLLGALIDEVAVQETYFMRERHELEAIDWAALLAAAKARGDREVRVWVCACASGEEAYSLAMLAIESLGEHDTPVSILASDISERALTRAKKGIYSERSTREVEQHRCERFFVSRGRGSAVGEELRALVRLRRHNLVSDPAPPLEEARFDLILCRNVLIYFDLASVETVVSKLESALQPAGQLILGASDRLSSIARRLGGGDVPAQRPSAAGSATSGWRRRAIPLPRRKSTVIAGATASAGASAMTTSATATTGATTMAGAAATIDTTKVARSAGDRAVAAIQRQVCDAREAANAGDYDKAIGIAVEILAADPLDAEAHFVRGLSELAAGDPSSAAQSLRRALYIEPTLAVAAFQLGRAYDLSGDPRAAVRAYRQALSVLASGDEEHLHLPEQVQASDIAAACRARLGRGG
jgi:chemotaxis protein methyltransferase CheR